MARCRAWREGRWGGWGRGATWGVREGRTAGRLGEGEGGHLRGARRKDGGAVGLGGPPSGCAKEGRRGGWVRVRGATFGVDDAVVAEAKGGAARCEGISNGGGGRALLIGVGVLLRPNHTALSGCQVRDSASLPENITGTWQVRYYGTGTGGTPSYSVGLR